MSNQNNDVAAMLMGFVFFIVLIYVAILSAIVLIATLAILIIGWYLTLLLFRWLDHVTDGQLLAEHGGVLLLLSGGLWALAAWLFVPQPWVYALTTLWPALASYPYIIPIIGGMFGLTWSTVVLYVAEQEADANPLDVAGMYSLTEQDLIYGDSGTANPLTDSIIVGADDNMWLS